MAWIVGLDIGGTKLAVAAGENGSIQEREVRATPARLSEGLELVHNMIGRVSRGRRPAAIGASVGGPLDHQRGIVSPLHQPEWRELPLKEIMEERWGCPFVVDVDTNVAALAEYEAAGDRPARLLYITISTGMGGGFLLDGAIYRGADGKHPEIGHQAIPYRCANPAAIRCECGAPDCLEALVSGNGIRRIYGRPAEELDREAWSEVAYNLGQGLRNLTAILAPGVIILGGGVALGGGEALIGEARTVMERRLRIVPVPELRTAVLGLEAPLRGALVLAQRALGA